jgi:hypothetical protein
MSNFIEEVSFKYFFILRMVIITFTYYSNSLIDIILAIINYYIFIINYLMMNSSINCSYHIRFTSFNSNLNKSHYKYIVFT